MNTGLTIGDFSRMTQLSVKTLRYYHRVGLLEPVDVSAETGFRYYDTAQIPTAQVIRRFRDLGMPVDDVKAVLGAPDVTARNALIAAHLDRLQEQLEHTEAAVVSLRNLLEHPDPRITVEHRPVPATRAVAVSGIVARDEIGVWWSAAFEEIHAGLDAHGIEPAGPGGGLYANDLFELERGTATVFVPVAIAPPDSGRTRELIVPAAELAIVEHRGTHDDIDLSYGALGTYVTHHALGVEGPIREYYAVGPADTPDTTRWRTEIGWPVFHTSGGDPRDDARDAARAAPRDSPDAERTRR